MDAVHIHDQCVIHSPCSMAAWPLLSHLCFCLPTEDATECSHVAHSPRQSVCSSSQAQRDAGMLQQCKQPQPHTALQHHALGATRSGPTLHTHGSAEAAACSKTSPAQYSPSPPWAVTFSFTEVKNTCANRGSQHTASLQLQPTATENPTEPQLPQHTYTRSCC